MWRGSNGHAQWPCTPWPFLTSQGMAWHSRPGYSWRSAAVAAASPEASRAHITTRSPAARCPRARAYPKPLLASVITTPRLPGDEGCTHAFQAFTNQATPPLCVNTYRLLEEDVRLVLTFITCQHHHTKPVQNTILHAKCSERPCRLAYFGEIQVLEFWRVFTGAAQQGYPQTRATHLSSYML